MVFASILSVTLVPALMVTLLRGKILPERKNPINRICIALYRPLLRWSLRARRSSTDLRMAEGRASAPPMIPTLV